MKKHLFLLVFPLLAFFSFESYSEDDCEIPGDCDGNWVPQTSITYTVTQVGCGATCEYTVNYSECTTGGVTVHRIDNIEATSTNPSCCQATATNDPIVSGYILEEAARLISLTGTSGRVYLPSKCWKWVGTVGPSGIHDAVLESCPTDSCCEFIYNGGVLQQVNSSGFPSCQDPGDPCMIICG